MTTDAAPAALPYPLKEAIALADANPQCFSIKILGQEPSPSRFPIVAFEAGSLNIQDPVLIVVAGRRADSLFGSRFALGWMRAVSNAFNAPSELSRMLSRMLLVVIPAANPSALSRLSRFNSQGVQLGRDAPVDAFGPVPFLFGGHRIAPWTPGYRGPRGSSMQLESQALLDCVMAHAFTRRFCMVLDCEESPDKHSRLWFPLHSSTEPMPWLPAMMRFKLFLDAQTTLEKYILAPRSHKSLAHGSLWDYAMLLAIQGGLDEGRLTLLTLGIGRKPLSVAPLQRALLNARSKASEIDELGAHAMLAEFLLTATDRHTEWLNINPAERSTLLSAALDLWWTESPSMAKALSKSYAMFPSSEDDARFSLTARLDLRRFRP